MIGASLFLSSGGGGGGGGGCGALFGPVNKMQDQKKHVRSVHGVYSFTLAKRFSKHIWTFNI